MKKQLAIAIVAIMLMAVLIVPTVMAFAVRDGNSGQYFSHRGYNSITYNSVTAYNQPYITLSNGIGAWESSSGVKYDFATGIPNCYGLKTSNLALDDSDDFAVVGEAPRCLLRNVRVNAFDLLNGTKTLLP